MEEYREYIVHVLESDLGLQAHVAQELQILRDFLHMRVISILLHISVSRPAACINAQTKIAKEVDIDNLNTVTENRYP